MMMYDSCVAFKIVGFEGPADNFLEVIYVRDLRFSEKD
jgi:hypothetical protein